MTERLMAAMIRYDSGDAKRIQHFLKVHALARLIGTEEGLDSDEMVILETAALVHDIGIRLCEKKYGRCSGDLQEKEGPAEARRLLEELGYPPAVIERVVYLVGHHHTYRHIDGRDYQILVEADFLVNLYAGGSAGKCFWRKDKKRRLMPTLFTVWCCRRHGRFRTTPRG